MGHNSQDRRDKGIDRDIRDRKIEREGGRERGREIASGESENS
jgi:hypothetical protein